MARRTPLETAGSAATTAPTHYDRSKPLTPRLEALLMAQRTTSLIPTGTWKVDAAHSTVGFAVKHMGIANVRGKLTELDGTLEAGEDLASSSASGSVKVASIFDGRGGSR